jgi:hypothetical protein
MPRKVTPTPAPLTDEAAALITESRPKVTGSKVTGALGPRRAIAAALRQLRTEREKSLDDVERELGKEISASKLSRLELAQGKLRRSDIMYLINYYEIEATPLASRLRRWVNAAQRSSWWTSFDADLLAPGGLDAHLGYEADAVVERAYTLPFVPALLQTTDYAEAVFRNMERRSEDKIRQLLEVRELRQEALRHREGGLDPLKLIAVMHESSVRQAVGPLAVLRDQLDALLERSQDPNVRLHVLPFTAPPVLTMTCMYAYFEYQDADNLEGDVVHIETQAGFLTIEEPKTVAAYREAHDALINASLDEDDSRRLISAARAEMSIK